MLNNFVIDYFLEKYVASYIMQNWPKTKTCLAVNFFAVILQ